MRYLILLVFLSGCATTYEYEAADGTSFKVRSYREFKRIVVKYNDLHLEASGVTDDTAEAATVISGRVLGTVDAAGNVWIKRPDNN